MLSFALAMLTVVSGLVTSVPHSRMVQPTLKRTWTARCMAAEPDTIKEKAKPVSTGDYYIELPYQNYMDGDRPAASWKLGADNFV